MNDISRIPEMTDRARLTRDDMFIYSGKHTNHGVDALNDIFKKAAENKVADIHFQQTKKTCRVRFRERGGDIEEVARLDFDVMRIMDEKIRTKSSIPTSDRLSALDGRLSLSWGESEYDVRVAISPAVSNGQLIVCRLLNQQAAQMRLDDIEMTASTKDAITSIIEEPNGLFLVTGPTGSGKTTTLYAMLNALNNGKRNIITIENPVEYTIDDFHQIDVNNRDLTFAGALRIAVRQDPDIIMIGEIRDKETADIAVQAAITGHLVISTTHANNAALGINRLLEFGVDPALLETALRGITAQRLIKRFDSNIELEYRKPNDLEAAWLRRVGISRSKPEYPFPVDDTNAFTQKRVMPAMEVILVDERLKKQMMNGEQAIFETASRQAQFETLGQAAERLAYNGITSLTEARKLVSAQQAINVKNKRMGQILCEAGRVPDEAMEELIEFQFELKRQGYYRRIGELMLENNLCSTDDLLYAIGRSAEAMDIIKDLCETDKKRKHLDDLHRRWLPGKDSLFDIAVSDDLITIEELKNACRI